MINNLCAKAHKRYNYARANNENQLKPNIIRPLKYYKNKKGKENNYLPTRQIFLTRQSTLETLQLNTNTITREIMIKCRILD